jgi:hypothetical protein
MKLDLVGRVRNTSLPFSKPLLPLFEAIINSIDGIEELGTSAGRIDVYIKRQPEIDFAKNGIKAPIQDFSIVDNGIGFNQVNFDAFATSDTTYKLSKGAKGIGRLIWLKAFDKVHVESIFKQDGRNYERIFNFLECTEGIVDEVCEELKGEQSNRTQVDLLGLKKAYRSECPLEEENIANRIIQHFLVYFMDESCPTITLHDSERKIELNQLYEKDFQKEATVDTLTIKNKKFQMTYFKLTHSQERCHRLHYCAFKREVKSEKLETKIPELARSLQDQEGNTFVFSIYLSGEYLDETVNPERTDFICDQEGGLFPTEIPWSQLHGSIIAKIKNRLEPYIKPIREDKLKRIEDYVSQKAPRYRPLLRHAKDKINEIKPGLSERDLDSALEYVDFELTQELRKKGEELLSSRIEDTEEYREKLSKFIDQCNDFGKSKLAEYVAHRRVILQLFKKALEQDLDGKYAYEERIHDLICPRGVTSDDIPYESINLWVIDERLSYHTYLASDQPFSKIEQGEYEGLERTDLTIFNNPLAFSDDEEPHHSVVILEFKRPARDDYSDRDNPIDQVIGYIEGFRNGKVKDVKGRPISAIENRRFYCYVICDLTSNLKKQVERRNFKKTPDGLGYYLYHDTYSAYIEILPFYKLLNDAEKRNRILFEKLNIL